MFFSVLLSILHSNSMSSKTKDPKLCWGYCWWTPFLTLRLGSKGKEGCYFCRSKGKEGCDFCMNFCFSLFPFLYWYKFASITRLLLYTVFEALKMRKHTKLILEDCKIVEVTLEKHILLFLHWNWAILVSLLLILFISLLLHTRCAYDVEVIPRNDFIMYW